MPNVKVVSPSLPRRGYRNESATTLTTGLAVKQGTAEDQVLLAGANDTVKGVVAMDQEVPQNGIVSIHSGHGGEVYVASGAAFAANAPLTPNAAGKWITATTGQKIQAISSGAASGADEMIAAILQDGKALVP